MITLGAQKRDLRQKSSILRKSGDIPAVFYGRKVTSTPISITAREFAKVWKTAGESSIITLKEKEGDEHQVLIQDVQKDPVTGLPTHADFYVIEKDQKLKIKVPIEFTGIAPATRDLGGILVKVMHELEIEALPKDLPHSVAVDISTLVDFKSQVLAKDISLPPGVSFVTNIHDVVAAISEPKAEEEKPAEPIDLSAIEVEKKGKEAKEGGEGEEAQTPEPAKKEGGT